MRLTKAVLCTLFAFGAQANAATLVEFAPWSSDMPVVKVAYESEGDQTFVFGNMDPSADWTSFPGSQSFGVNWMAGAYQTMFAPTRSLVVALGSTDVYDKLELSFENGSTARLSAAQLKDGAIFDNGNQLIGLTDGIITYNVAANAPRLVGATLRTQGESYSFSKLSTNAVPEPATWALMVGGFGLVGFGLRRRASARRGAIA